MRRAKCGHILLGVLFWLLLAGMGALLWLQPKQEFSDLELRYLQKMPRFSWQSLQDGSFDAELEQYVSDHLPGRQYFLGLGAYARLAISGQGAGGIVAAEGFLLEPPIEYEEELLQKNMDYVNQFAEKADIPLDLMVIPSAGYVLGFPYPDGEILETISPLSASISQLFREHSKGQQLFYRTDHHWTSLGAYTACSAYLQALGRSCPPEDAFHKENIPDFRGSTYRRSCLWLTDAEPLQLWQGSRLWMQIGENPWQEGVFFWENLQGADKYTVFLGGNQGLVRLYNPNNQGKGSILVLRDSFGSCFATFLAESYEQVVLVDLRYYKKAVSALMEQEDFSRILVLYSLQNFVSDSNFLFLK